MSHDRGCFKCGEDVSRAACGRKDCPRSSSYGYHLLEGHDRSISKNMAETRLLLRLDKITPRERRLEAKIKHPTHGIRLGLIDGATIFNDKLHLLVMIYRKEDEQKPKEKRRFLNSETWTRTYRPLEEVQIMWEGA